MGHRPVTFIASNPKYFTSVKGFGVWFSIVSYALLILYLSILEGRRSG